MSDTYNREEIRQRFCDACREANLFTEPQCNECELDQMLDSIRIPKSMSIRCIPIEGDPVDVWNDFWSAADRFKADLEQHSNGGKYDRSLH